MKAGPEMNALVAEKVMGLKVLGSETCVYVDGDATVHVGSSPKGWACFAEIGPVVAGEYCRCKEHKADLRYKDFTWKYDHLEVCLKPVKNYSTSIADAWPVVEKLKADGWNVSLCGDNGWGCTFYKVHVQGDRHIVTHWEEFHGPINAETAPLAICLAALKVVGYTMEVPQ